MKNISIKTRLASLLTSTLSVGVLSAASITWIGVPTTLTSDSDIDLTGSLARAGTWGSDAVMVDLGSETILFNNEEINSPGSVVNVTANAPTGEDNNPAYFDSTGATGLSAEFETVLDSFAWDGPNPKVLSVNDLIAGQEYQIQLFTSDDRATPRTRTQLWSDDATLGAGNESPTFIHGDSVYVIGQFTADASGTQDIFGHGVDQMQTALNGYVLRVVPEPSSALLAGIAGLFLLRRRR